MPTYRSITISLISQFDILIIPEYEPPKAPLDPFLNAPKLVNADHSLVSVYIPTYPSSQFWLCYSISPPYPPGILYYFKLFINGDHIVSWGCGKEDGYEGKTTFGLFHPGPSPFPHSEVERRVFCFGPDPNHGDTFTVDNLNDVLEVRVFRSKGRQQIASQLQDFQSLPGRSNVDRNKSQLHSSGNGINLVNAGSLPDQHPREFYKYALVDPLDQPFATFRYYYRSWDQLEALGVISPTPSTESSSVRSRTPIEHALSPEGSSNGTFYSSASKTDKQDNCSANSSTDTIIRPLNATNFTSPAETASSTDSPFESPDFTSPIRITITPPPAFRRPPTPPPFATSSRLAQLPTTIPATDTALNTLASKESFTSLIRQRFPSPDPLAFQLPELVTEPRAPNPVARNRSASLSTLMNVVNSAKSRKGRREEGGDEQIGIETEGSNLTSSIIERSKRNEQDQIDINRDDSGLTRSEDSKGRLSEREEGMHWNRLSHMERERRRREEAKMMANSDDGSGSTGSRKGNGGEGSGRKAKRKLNLWEVI